MHRSVTAAVLAVALALPAAAAAQSRPDGTSVRLVGLMGLDRGELDGVTLRGDAEVDLHRLSEKLVLAGIGSLGYSRISGWIGLRNVSANLFTAGPAVRLRFEATPRTGGYADVGAGLYLMDTETEHYEGPTTNATDVGFMARVALGWYVTSAKGNRVQVEASAAPRFGEYEERAAQRNAFQVMVGVAFAIR